MPVELMIERILDAFTFEEFLEVILSDEDTLDAVYALVEGVVSPGSEEED